MFDMQLVMGTDGRMRYEAVNEDGVRVDPMTGRILSFSASQVGPWDIRFSADEALAGRNPYHAEWNDGMFRIEAGAIASYVLPIGL